MGGYPLGALLESVLAVALTLRGAQVDILLCDGLLAAHRTIGQFRHDGHGGGAGRELGYPILGAPGGATRRAIPAPSHPRKARQLRRLLTTPGGLRKRP